MSQQEKLKIFANMEVSPGKFSETDLILCNNDYKEVNDDTNKFNGIMCKNYRKILVYDEDIDNEIIYYLKVASNDIDSNKDTKWHTNFISKYCDINDPNIIKFRNKGLLTDEKTVYYKGAFVVFPPEWEELMKKGKYINPKQIEIYKNAARGLMIHILKILKKIGFNTIIVDPAPGFHPNTFEKNDAEKINGLIKLYEKIGLVEIGCSARTSILEVDKIYSELIRDAINPIETDYLHKEEAYSRKQNIKGALKSRGLEVNEDNKYKAGVMIGDIDELLNKINDAESWSATLELIRNDLMTSLPSIPSIPLGAFKAWSYLSELSGLSRSSRESRSSEETNTEVHTTNLSSPRTSRDGNSKNCESGSPSKTCEAIKAVREFNKVPIRKVEKIDDDYFTQAQYDDLLKTEPINMKNKYQKYKAKYLLLKKQLNKI